MSGPEWTEFASCQYVDAGLFFPVRYDTAAGKHQASQAKKICVTECAVRSDCLTYALTLEQGTGLSSRDGICGGHDPAERNAMDKGEHVSDLIDDCSHGTRPAVLFGCRCDDCNAYADRLAEIERARRQNNVPPGVSHGTQKAAITYRCPCDLCRARVERDYAATKGRREAQETAA